MRAATCSPLPLVPPGTVVLDPAFDAGAPFVYASTHAGLLSFDMRDGRVRVLQANTAATGNPLPVAAAGGVGGRAVYLLSSVGPTWLGDAGVPPSSAASLGEPDLVACGRDTSCRRAAALAEAADLLTTDRDDAGSSVVATSDGVHRINVSRDGGATFQSVALPAHHWLYGLQVFESGGRLAMAAVLPSVSGQVTLGTWREGDAAMRVVALDPLLAQAPAVVSSVALGTGRVLLGSSAARGVHCSIDAGHTWAATCPPP